ncbi:MAG: DUF4290 domain-containing protein [Prevotella sp.]|nr:DUF4290 domain-containing protein [Prevotella sp.]MDD7028190.1 DUF4290 domain-containing protein [Prevotellaceae bacterium]MDD7076491.1 DUF4290 domain-containing protein [Prevotellaceae bacterium]MDY5210192.1 DUF4290 domain-containing protein [Prevotella sp.]MDY5343092.1 DUF4290 domain-containing protein [Prevotella sp.]
MDIKGLDYNTKRETLLLPEYGREIQRMVDYAIGCPTRDERNACANTIVRMMGTKVPNATETNDGVRALWDHLYIMGRGQLDIDWPYDMSEAVKITQKPQPMPIRKNHVKLRHYGHLVEECFDILKTMPNGRERDKLIYLTANQMKRDLAIWGRGTMDDERVADDLARFTDGCVQLDINNMRLERVQETAALMNVNGNRMAKQGKKRKK